MSNETRKNPGNYVVRKGPGELSIDQQLATWARDWEHYIMSVMTSYMSPTGKVDQPYLRGVALTIDDLEAFMLRGWQVQLPVNLRSTGGTTTLLPKAAPETDDAAARTYYQRLRDADLALLREIRARLNKVADAHEPVWVSVGAMLKELLLHVDVSNLRQYRTPQELLMDCHKQMGQWMRGKGTEFVEFVNSQWKQVFRHLTDIVLADRPRIRDALKRREDDIDSYENLMKFFQGTANELEKLMEPLAMWEQVFGVKDGLGRRAVEDLNSEESEEPEGHRGKARRKMLQPKTTDGSGGTEKEKIACSYLLKFGNCKNAKCPFEHDESAMPNSKRQQLVLVGTSAPEKEKEKGNPSKKKKYEFKMGGCMHCWMPRENPDFKSSHGNGDKYGKETCPYSAEPQGCKKEKN